MVLLISIFKTIVLSILFIILALYIKIDKTEANINISDNIGGNKIKNKIANLLNSYNIIKSNNYLISHRTSYVIDII